MSFIGDRTLVDRTRPQRATPSGEIVPIFGIPFCDLTIDTALSRLEALLRTPELSLVVLANAHTLNLAWQDETYRRVLASAALVLRDGSGVGLAARLQGRRLRENFCGTDFVPFALGRLLDGRGRVFLYGARPGIADSAADELCSRVPTLQVVGTCHGYGEDRVAVEAIQETKPDVLLVALGNPLQEKWIAKHAHELPARLAFGVGALFDYLAGVVPRAPHWLRSAGCEWIYRLAVEPRRLAGRYLVGNPRFIARALRDAVSQRGAV